MTSRFLLAGVLFGFMPAASAGLIGSQVTGFFTDSASSGGGANFFDPNVPTSGTSYEVPAGYLNSSGTTVTIQEPAIEFGTELSLCFCNLFTANFTDSQLVIDATAGFTYFDSLAFEFTDPVFSSITEVSNDWPDTFLSSSLSGDVISIGFSAVSAIGGQNYQAVFDVGSAGTATPEPSTVVIMATGLLAIYTQRKRGFLPVRTARINQPTVRDR
jgi:hypothetical protein